MSSFFKIMKNTLEVLVFRKWDNYRENVVM